MIGHLLEFLIVRVLARLFPGRYRVIPRMPDGAPLLRQFRICSFGKEKPRGTPPRRHFSIYLQSFVNAEVSEDFHIHRWARMVSVVLSGKFVEERYPGSLYLTHKAPSLYAMNWTTIHRFHLVAVRTWTLFIMMGRNPFCEWGYLKRPEPWPWNFREGGYRPWNAAIPPENRIDSL